jgi:hypothetical protein
VRFEPNPLILWCRVMDEPPTNSLQNRCSTTDLIRQIGSFSQRARELPPDKLEHGSSVAKN